MNTTALKLTVRITKEDLRQLEKLTSDLGESKSQIVRRALNDLYIKKLIEEKTCVNY